MFGLTDRSGELVLPILDERYGDSFFSFVQALLRISDVSLLTREIVRSTFVEDLKGFLKENGLPDPKRR